MMNTFNAKEYTHRVKGISKPTLRWAYAWSKSDDSGHSSETALEARRIIKAELLRRIAGPKGRLP